MHKRECPAPSSRADNSMNIDQNLTVVDEFAAARGRPLRVLHIGNIANNAYNNALIQRRFGIEADTICYDYYHVMGCPEWEAASFDEKIDNMFPDWWSTKLGGWQRPEWVVQGPVPQCLSYFCTKNAGDFEAASYFWNVLQAQYWEMLDLVASTEGRVRPPMPEHLAKAILAWREHFVFKSLPPPPPAVPALEP